MDVVLSGEFCGVFVFIAFVVSGAGDEDVGLMERRKLMLVSQR